MIIEVAQHPARDRAFATQYITWRPADDGRDPTELELRRCRDIVFGSKQGMVKHG